ncbi:hypothetical protein [Microcoleus sp.]
MAATVLTGNGQDARSTANQSACAAGKKASHPLCRGKVCCTP